MGSRFVRAVFELELDEETTWYSDKEAIGKLADLTLASDLGEIFTHAGREDNEKPAKDVAAVRRALATGKAGSFSALDAPDLDRSTSKLLLRLDSTSLRYTVRVGGKALTERIATVLHTLDRIARGLIGPMRKRGGLSRGYIYLGDDEEEMVYPRPRPPVMGGFGPMRQLAQYFDVRYYNDPARSGEMSALIRTLASAAVPAGVARTERDQLVTLRWIDSLADDAAVGRAFAAYEAWLAQVASVEPERGYNALGDLEITLADRAQRPPFTVYDPLENIGYKAIMVAPNGDVDEDIWKEQQSALINGSPENLRVRLIVPLRDLALNLRARARRDGFDAVLYPDDRNRLWDPDPPGLWIEDVRPTPTSGAESTKESSRKKA